MTACQSKSCQSISPPEVQNEDGSLTKVQVRLTGPLVICCGNHEIS